MCGERKRNLKMEYSEESLIRNKFSNGFEKLNKKINRLIKFRRLNLAIKSCCVETIDD